MHTGAFKDLCESSKTSVNAISLTKLSLLVSNNKLRTYFILLYAHFASKYACYCSTVFVVSKLASGANIQPAES